ncbi:MAG: hypothetical protein LUC22_06170 [Prevotella sp.]|nr:hypothetical protein [Prevotella sp.]
MEKYEASDWADYFSDIQEIPYEITFDPADGEIITSFSGPIYISASGYATPVDESDFSGLTITNEAGETVATGQSTSHGITRVSRTDAFSEYKLYVDILTDDGSLPGGTYTINLPEGFFYTDSGKTATSEATTSTFYIPDFQITDPARETVSAIDSITITSNVPFHCKSSSKASDISICKTGGDGGSETVAQFESLVWNGDADVYDDYTSCTLYLTEPVTETGTYSVTIPADFFNLQSAELERSWDVENLTLTPSPADGDEVENLTELTVSCDVGFVLSSEGAYTAITLTDADGETVATVVSAEPGEDGTSYTLTLSDRLYVHSPLFPAGGTYTLTIPDGVFTVGVQAILNEETVAAYTLVGDEPIPTLGFDPAPVDEDGEGGTVDELHSLYITVVEGAGLSIHNPGLSSSILLTDAEGNQLAAGESCDGDDETADEDGNYTRYLLTLDTTIVAAGEYTVYVPKNIFTLTAGDGTRSQSVDTYAVFIVSGEYAVTLSPASGSTVTALDAVTFSREDGLELADGADVSSVKVYDADGEDVAYGASSTATDGGLTIGLNTTVSTTGTYTLLVPADVFVFGNSLTNKEITATYTVDPTSGITGVNTEKGNGAVEIYNVAGWRVNTPVRGQINIIRKSDGSVKKIMTK